MNRFAAFCLLLTTCVSAPPPSDDSISVAATLPKLLRASFSTTGERVLVVRDAPGGCRLQLLDATGRELANHLVGVCPQTLFPLRSGGWLAQSSGGSLWLDSDLASAEPTDAVAAVSRDNFVEASGDARLFWKRDSNSIELPRNLKQLRLSMSGDALFGVTSDVAGENLARVTPAGEVRTLFPEAVRRIDSFDVSPDGAELVFSADRMGNLDVGLVSAEGSDIRWIAPDPADEKGVSWAPRGNKVTYVVTTATGSLLRTVHVPTAYQVVVDVAFSDVRSISWEPRAERFLFVRDSLHDGTAVESVGYAGDRRSVLTTAAAGFRGEPDVIVNAGVRAHAFVPATLGYGETVPAVVWVGRGAPEQGARHSYPPRVAHVIVSSDEPGALFWERLFELAWIDPARVIVVDTSGTIAPPDRGVTRIGVAASDPPPPGRVRAERWGRNDRAVSLNPADRASVVPFAASYIGTRFAGGARANGSG